jgi:alkyl hydroperoxide reductase subunit AhpC
MSGFTLEQESFFNKKNTKLLGLSIDSIHSHIAWVDKVKKYEERVNSNYEMVDFYLAKKQLT